MSARDTTCWSLTLGGGALALVGLGWLALRDKNRAGFFAVLGALAFHTVPPLSRSVDDGSQTPPTAHSSASEATLTYLPLLVVVVVLLVALWGLGRLRLPWKRLTAASTVGAVAATAWALYPYAMQPKLPNPGSHHLRFDELDPRSTPDIYYIVLDAYGRHDVLQTLYEFDNTTFLEDLERRGFFVAQRSFSNYPQTAMSLASSLNMAYLDTLDPLRHTRSSKEYRRQLFQWVRIAQVPRALKKLGYRYETISGRWVPSGTSPDATTVHRCRTVSDFDVLMVEQTILASWRESLVGRSLRDEVLCQYEELSAVAARPGPKFVLAHIVSPHSPWLFDRHGRPVHDESSLLLQPGLNNRDLYLEQVLFNNTKVLQAIDRILRASATPPIIVVQGDHGPQEYEVFHRREVSRLIRRRKPGPIPPPEMQPEGMFTPHLWERHGILNALYLPDFPVDQLTQELSPVNTFRLIFNHYFGAELPILDDRAIYALYGRRQIHWDITETLAATTAPPTVSP